MNNLSRDDAPVIMNWRVTTRRALTRPVVPSFVSILRRRLRGTALDEEAVATALHEAIANAAIHGNLGITAAAADGLDPAFSLSERIEAALADPVLAGRPLVIAALRQGPRLMLTVRDCGNGFAPERIMVPSSGRPHGRGIQLMRALASSVHFQLGGRECCLVFNLLQDHAAANDETGELFVLGSRILIVDDSQTQRAMIAHALTAAGFTDIYQAADGNEAVRLYYDVQPDLMLLDIAMPGMDGIDVCRTLNSRHPGAVPIIVQSGIEHPEERVRAFAAGARDYLVKPLHPPELIARVRTQLQNRWLVHSLHRFRARLSDELNAARLMQESLLPSRDMLQSLRSSMGLDIAAHCEMSSELGGDIWGLRVIDETRIGLFIADFTGHGVGSAVNAFRLHAVLGESGIRFERPDLVMQALNVRLHGALQLGSFATLVYAVLDTARNRLDYTAAGAPPPILIRPDGGTTAIDTSGVPVGIKPWHDYTVRTLPFPPGASLFLYSDALIETPDAFGQSWGMDRLDRLAGAGARSPAETQLAQLLEAFDAHRPRPLPDDLTLIFLRRVI